jgi:hypothetical protein
MSGQAIGARGLLVHQLAPFLDQQLHRASLDGVWPKWPRIVAMTGQNVEDSLSTDWVIFGPGGSKVFSIVRQGAAMQRVDDQRIQAELWIAPRQQLFTGRQSASPDRQLRQGRPRVHGVTIQFLFWFAQGSPSPKNVLDPRNRWRSKRHIVIPLLALRLSFRQAGIPRAKGFEESLVFHN